MTLRLHPLAATLTLRLRTVAAATALGLHALPAAAALRRLLTLATASALGTFAAAPLLLGLLISALPATGLRCRRGRNRQSGDTRGQE